MINFIGELKKLDACEEAIEWLKEGDYETPQAAWDACTRSDWMLWLLGKLSGKPGSAKRRKFVLCTCECVRFMLKYVPAGEERPLRAIEVAENWAQGKATIEDVRAAANAAYAAAYAANAAYAAANAADDAAGAREKALAQCADIMRKHYPNVPKI